MLIAEAGDWLRRARILFPAVSTLQRLVGQARADAEEQVQQVVMRQLQPVQIGAGATNGMRPLRVRRELRIEEPSEDDDIN